jgi:hypothetical protein
MLERAIGYRIELTGAIAAAAAPGGEEARP